MRPISTMGGGLTLEFGEGTTLTTPADRHYSGRPTGAQTATRFPLLATLVMIFTVAISPSAQSYQYSTPTFTLAGLASTEHWFPWISATQNHKNRSWRPGLLHVARRNFPIIPSVRLREHEYLYSTLPIIATAPALAGATATFNRPNESTTANHQRRYRGQWTPRISTFVGYQGQLGRDNYDANGVTGTIGFNF
jgi:hypothetical protein